MPPSLEKVLTLRLYQSKENILSFSTTKGSAPRFIAPLAAGGYLTSHPPTAPFTATFIPGGSDWLRMDPTTGTGHLDARVQFRCTTDPTAVFYVQFEGIVRTDEEIKKVFEWSPEARTTNFGEGYNFVMPVVEVSKEEWKWMEETVFLGWERYVVEGEGEERRQAVEYEIFRAGTP